MKLSEQCEGGVGLILDTDVLIWSPQMKSIINLSMDSGFMFSDHEAEGMIYRTKAVAGDIFSILYIFLGYFY